MAQSIAGTHLDTTWAYNSARVAMRVRCDWNKDGDYGDTLEDITGHVTSINIQHKLYDQLAGLPLLGNASPGSASLVVSNEDRWFSPDNGAGLAGAYAGLASGIFRIPVQIDMGYYYGETPEYLVQFVGEIEGADESESYGNATVQFVCTDNSIALLQDKRSTGVYVDYRPDELMALLLVDSGMLTYDLDRSMSDVPYSWLDDENVYEECRALAAADGGMFFFSKGGVATYRRMTAPLERDDSLAPVAVLDQGNASGYRNSIAWRDTYSGVICEWAGRYPGPVTELWRAPGPIAVAPGETVTEKARFRYPATGSLVPVYGKDYQALTSAPSEVPYGASGVELTKVHYGQHADISITSHLTYDTLYITNLVIRGFPLLGEEAQERRWNQTAGLVPGEKVYPVRGNPFVQTEEQVSRIGPYLRDRLQRPRRMLSWVGPACPWLELLDRVTLSHHTMTPNPGVDLDCYVVGVSMSCDSRGAWMQTLTLLPVIDVYAYSEYFLLGSSVYYDPVGANQRVAY